MGLTAKRVARVRSKIGRYFDARGLYLQVLSPTNAAWVYRYQKDGRQRWMGLGPIDLVSLEEARDKAHAARKLLFSGIDPLDQRAAEKAATRKPYMTFEAAARQYHKDHLAKWRSIKGPKQFLASLEAYAFPIIGADSVADIDRAAVLRVLEQKHANYPDVSLWSAIPRSAAHLRARIEAILDWSASRGYRTGDNPARWAGALKHVLPSWRQLKKPTHHPALPYAELPSFLAELRKREGVAARALEFTILCASRTSEVLGAQWSEVNLSDKVWVVPAERMKAGREHRVPLTARAVAILQSLPREENNEFLFIGLVAGKGLGHAAMAGVLKRMGRIDISVHGFRSCFADWAHECSAFPKTVIDMALAHAIGDKVEAAYRRGTLLQKRRQLMDAFESYCASGTRAAEVIALRA